MDKAVRAKVLTESLYRFNKLIVQGGNPLDQLREKPHLELCRTVQDWSRKRRKLILMPRGTFKSSAVTVGYSLLEIVKNPNIRILIGSEINATAKKFLREIKDHLESNERLRHYYGDHMRLKSRWTDDEITSKLRTKKLKEPTVFTTGTDQSRTGMHCDLAIIDDPVSLNNLSPDAREKTLNWYREITNNILEPYGHLIVIGTRYHFDDLYQHIIEEEKDNYDIVVKQAMSNEDYKILISERSIAEKQHLMKELIFPERLNAEELWNKYKSSGSSMFNNQFMNRIVSDEDAPFKEANLQWYEGFQAEDRANTYICVDPAISEKQTGDFTAIMCVRVNHFNQWKVIDYDNFKGKPQEIIDRIFAMYQRHPARKIGIEVVAYQKSLIYSLRDEERKRAIKLPLFELQRDNDTTKEMRIMGTLQPLIEQKRLYLQTGMNELIEQLKTFPRSRHDDLLDALADCVQIMGIYHGTRKTDTLVSTRAEQDDKRDAMKSPRFSIGGRSRFTNY